MRISGRKRNTTGAHTKRSNLSIEPTMSPRPPLPAPSNKEVQNLATHQFGPSFSELDCECLSDPGACSRDPHHLALEGVLGSLLGFCTLHHPPDRNTQHKDGHVH
jgi:hypothetical protein